MKKNNIEFYGLGEINLKKQLAKKEKNGFKAIICNFIIISALFIFVFGASIIYITKKSNEMTALVYNKNAIEIEKMNNSSNNLLSVNINYNEKYEILINKANKVDEDIISLYNQVNVENNIYSNVKLEETTYKNYLKLKNAISKKGYYLNIRSGFRTFEESTNIYNSYASKYGNIYAENYVAAPGASEHNTGLCFDVIISDNENSTSNNYQSDAYKYLENIAYLYGFIIRYPKDKENITGYSYEPWHLRYVGKELAKYLTKNNLTLEEYYEIKEQ